MKIRRRTFLKTGGGLLAALFTGSPPRPLVADHLIGLGFGKEVAGRCPLCSLGCGLIYRSTGFDRWHVEGDPDCPTGAGTLCARGSTLTATAQWPEGSRPLYKPPGGSRWEKMGWKEAVDLLARRIKDLRDRDLSLLSSGGEEPGNQFDSLGVITGGNLTNEEAYLISKLFRCLGVSGMDTTARASHGMGVQGLMDALGLPGSTHSPNQIAFSDVVVLVGCNPGQTGPVISRFLDRVRRRRGTVIVIDPRKSETVKEEDIWLRVRPGSDNTVLGTFVNWILERGDMDRSDIVERSDAAFIVLSEIMGEYEVQTSGKYRNWPVVDNTLSEPYSIYQRMKRHFERYDLRKVAGISGVDLDLLRRACTLIARTSDPNFSASFVFGSGGLCRPSGADAVRMAAAAQALLGNFDKKGGGVIMPLGAGNAQGVCDMGLLSPYLPGYLTFPGAGSPAADETEPAGLEALIRAWFPNVEPGRAMSFLPRLYGEERPTLSGILQGIADEKVRALLVVGSDPASSLTDASSIRRMLGNLDLLVVMDATIGRTGLFWKGGTVPEQAVKTEALFIPTEPPALKQGTMTDSGRRVREVNPMPVGERSGTGLLQFLVSLGNSLRSKYSDEGGGLPAPVLEMNWPLAQDQVEVGKEINGWRKSGAGGEESLLPEGGQWEKGDRCGNRLYRGWMTGDDRLARRRGREDPHGLGLLEKWGWFWPWGVADPFSRVRDGERTGVHLRWAAQGADARRAENVLPIRPRLPVRFWKMVAGGSPFPEHYEPFHSPLPDFLTGGRSNPFMSLRKGSGAGWGYLSRRPDEVLADYPVIFTVHRTGNAMGTGGIVTLVEHLRELGTARIVEMGPALAGELGVRTGDTVTVHSPYWKEGIRAAALVTGRIGHFTDDGNTFHVASITLFGSGDAGLNVLTAPAFDRTTGGLEMKAFMGRIERAV